MGFQCFTAVGKKGSSPLHSHSHTPRVKSLQHFYQNITVTQHFVEENSIHPESLNWIIPNEGWCKVKGRVGVGGAHLVLSDEDRNPDSESS